MRVIIPMAGAGRRFREAGYEEPKPQIRVRDRHMIGWAVWPLAPETQFLFITEQDQDIFSLPLGDGQCEPFQRPRPMWVQLWQRTEGAACTVLAAAVGLPADEPVAVMNCDQVFKADVAQIERDCLVRGDDGFILTFTATDSKWSFVDADMNGKVSRVAEKVPISDQATVGFYWFRRARDLVWAIATSIHLDRRVNGEFYLCPVYQHLIDRGQVIRAVPVEWFHGLGTPEDVAAFEALEEVPL